MTPHLLSATSTQLTSSVSRRASCPAQGLTWKFWETHGKIWRKSKQTSEKCWTNWKIQEKTKEKIGNPRENKGKHRQILEKDVGHIGKSERKRGKNPRGNKRTCGKHSKTMEKENSDVTWFYPWRCWDFDAIWLNNHEGCITWDMCVLSSYSSPQDAGGTKSHLHLF